ncbi:hypothetical protein [Nocardia sp. NBC_00511]|uniref:hypothetical protein n=1 Tax=Nocardia sp. NBC_00511 TaxID=2903591 RepID=UPI0030E2BE92
MVERKTPATKPRGDVVKVVAAATPEPVGRFYDLQKEVTAPKPYVLTDDIVFPALTRGQMLAVNDASTEEAVHRAVFGAHYDAVNALYENRPVAEWRAFEADFNRHFFGPSAEEAPGKSEESSDS